MYAAAIDRGRPLPVWIDADPSVGIGEVDDGLALIQAMNSNELDIKGVSVVFGNAGVQDCYNVARQIVSSYSEMPNQIPVYIGAASITDEIFNEAAFALGNALQRGGLTLIALGPLTNIARMLKLFPLAVQNITELVAVAGRRASQKFQVGNMTGSFPDLNFEKDVYSFKYVVDVLGRHGKPVVLTPWEISSKVWLTASHINHMINAMCPSPLTAPTYDEAKSACELCASEESRTFSSIRCANLLWVLGKSLLWADLWMRNFGTPGFNPFDTLAVGYILTPWFYKCDLVSVHFLNCETARIPPPVIEAHSMNNFSIHLSTFDVPTCVNGATSNSAIRCSNNDRGDYRAHAYRTPELVLIETSADESAVWNGGTTYGKVKYCHSIIESTSRNFIDDLLRRLIG